VNIDDYHYIPDDGYGHVKDMSCPCGPQMIAIPWVAAGIAHQRIDMKVPNYVPEEWAA